jgi:hypothetical protein
LGKFRSNFAGISCGLNPLWISFGIPHPLIF